MARKKVDDSMIKTPECASENKQLFNQIHILDNDANEEFFDNFVVLFGCFGCQVTTF